MKLFYVDDSGAEATGYACFSWLEVPADHWKQGLREILDWRQTLTAAHRIPSSYELHATKFANGRGNPSLDASWNRSKAKRSEVMDSAMDFLGSRPWLGIGTVYSESVLRRDHFAAERSRVYSELVTLIDGRLTAADEFGILIMDGDGTDNSYTAAHRRLKLATRSLIEDPMFQHSHGSQWVQLADTTAYAAYQHLLRHEMKRFAWGWYPSLQMRDVLGEPQRV